MKFKYYDSLRLFTVVASHASFTASANDLNLTKGAVSYQIKQLENALGFKLFERQKSGIVLTNKGRELLAQARVAFDRLESGIENLRQEVHSNITIGMTTYFASRWLSPRLMNFTSRNPNIGLRLQPTVGVVDLHRQNIDMEIRWGTGDWVDLEIECLFKSPVAPTSGKAVARRVEQRGLHEALSTTPLLHDYDGSRAWRDWYRAAGLTLPAARDDLVIPDPNVRVQAVIDGQGIALNDALVNGEIAAGNLLRISEIKLDNYGYFLAYPDGALVNSSLRLFRDWIMAEAGIYQS